MRFLKALAATLLFGALPAAAKIDAMWVVQQSGPALCDHFTQNTLDYGRFLDQSQHIPLPRGATIRVTLTGFGADLATGTQDDISNLTSSIVDHGTMEKPGGGIFFGQAEKTGFVTVQIHAKDNAELGNGNVQVNWLTGHERIPVHVVASCNPTPTHTPRPAGTSAPVFIPRQLTAGSAPPAAAQPDLIPTDFVNFRTGVGPNDCNGAFTGQRRFTQPDLKFGVRNISNVAFATPFVVLLRKADGTELRRVTVAGLAANGFAEFEFHRQQSEVCVQKGPNGFGCNACGQLVNDTGIEVVVDFDKNVAEVSETNNSRKIN